MSIVRRQQVCPGSVSVGVCIPVGREEIARRVVGIAVGGGAIDCLGQLSLVVVAVCPASVGAALGGNIAVRRVGIGKRRRIGEAPIGQGRDLPGGLAAGDRPVSVGLGVGAADALQTVQSVIGVGQRVAGGGGHSCHAAVGGIVGVAFAEGAAADLVALLGEPVIPVVLVPGGNTGFAALYLAAADQPAQRIVAIAVFYGDFAAGVHHPASGGIAAAVVGEYLGIPQAAGGGVITNPVDDPVDS